MNTTLLLFLSTFCGLLSLLVFIYIGKQVARIITHRRTSPLQPPFRPHYTHRNSESSAESIDVPLPVRSQQSTGATISIPEITRPERPFILRPYDRDFPNLAYPARVIYDSRGQQESFAPANDHR